MKRLKKKVKKLNNKINKEINKCTVLENKENKELNNKELNKELNKEINKSTVLENKGTVLENKGTVLESAVLDGGEGLEALFDGEGLASSLEASFDEGSNLEASLDGEGFASDCEGEGEAPFCGSGGGDGLASDLEASFGCRGVKVIHEDLTLFYDANEVWFDKVAGVDKERLYKAVKEILRKIKSVNKGFVVNTKVGEVPVIGDILEYFVIPGECGFDEVVKRVKVTEWNKWLFNTLILNLYRLMVEELMVDESLKDVNEDFIEDYKNMMVDLVNSLDPSIRCKINKRSIGVIQNIYTGFDTEYSNIDMKFNEVISIQVAVNCRTYLKIPLNCDYYFSQVDALKSKIYKVVTDIKECSKIEASLSICISKIRKLRYKDYDVNMDLLVRGLRGYCERNSDKMACFEKNDYLVVRLPSSPIKTKFYENREATGISISDLVKLSKSLGEDYLSRDYEFVKDLIKMIVQSSKVDLSLVDLSLVTDSADDGAVELKTLPADYQGLIKRRSLSRMRGVIGDDVCMNRVETVYLIAHLTNADLSVLKDFDIVKEELNIVNNSFVTMGRPINIDNTNVVIRDTMLLTPAAKKGLADLGRLHGIDKIKIPDDKKGNMDKLIKEDRDLFVEYAVRDALISLIHANYMEDINFKSREVGIPLTLSSLGQSYVLNEWDLSDYRGYQISGDYLIGDTGAIQTPLGLLKTRDIGLNMGLFIANYKGGRNESYMYGVDNERIWYDFDLVSAYTTIMAGLGNPVYSRGRKIRSCELNSMSADDLIYSYTIIQLEFEFPDNTKYPSIPCYLDEDQVPVYPLKGKGVLTGVEYLLARKQGCKLEIKDAFHIPFESSVDDNGEKLFVNRPFFDVIKKLQKLRTSFEKGSLGNLLYKQIGNSIYGNTVRGISNKKKFDIKTGRAIRMEGGYLSNPIIASWTTAFMRSIIGECLNVIDDRGGLVISATTDGFITNLEESEFVGVLNNCNTVSLFGEFKKLRKALSGDDKALELKNSGKGIISWTTRGQFSLDANIKATSGFQTRGFQGDELHHLFVNTLSKEDKKVIYIQKSLRSAVDIYKQGGHVTDKYSEKSYRMEYDNKRVIVLPQDLVLNNNNDYDFSSILLDSKPARDVGMIESLRSLSKFHRSHIYNKQTSKSFKGYKSYLEVAVRNFIRGYLSTPPLYNLHSVVPMSYSEIVDFLKSYDVDLAISKSYISKMKSRKMILKQVPATKETLDFAEWLKVKFPKFDSKSFFIGQ